MHQPNGCAVYLKFSFLCVNFRAFCGQLCILWKLHNILTARIIDELNEENFLRRYEGLFALTPSSVARQKIVEYLDRFSWNESTPVFRKCICGITTLYENDSQLVLASSQWQQISARISANCWRTKKSFIKMKAFRRFVVAQFISGYSYFSLTVLILRGVLNNGSSHLWERQGPALGTVSEENCFSSRVVEDIQG